MACKKLKTNVLVYETILRSIQGHVSMHLLYSIDEYFRRSALLVLRLPAGNFSGLFFKPPPPPKVYLPSGADGFCPFLFYKVNRPTT